MDVLFFDEMESTPKQSSKMSASAIVNIRKINASDITFAEPKKSKTGATSIALRYKDQNVQFRLPQLSYPGGALIRTTDKGDTTYTLIASLKGCDPYGKERATSNDDVAYLYNFMTDFQEHLIKHALENSVRIFGKKRSEESLRETFKQSLSVSVDKTPDGEYIPNGKYPPSIRFKFPVWDNKLNMEVIDSENMPVEVSLANLTSVFPKNVSARTVVSGSVYVAGLSFGVTWKITDAQIVSQKRKTIFEKFRDDEEDVEEAEAEAEEQVTTDQTNPETHEEVPAPAPEPVLSAPEKPKSRRAKA